MESLREIALELHEGLGNHVEELAKEIDTSMTTTTESSLDATKDEYDYSDDDDEEDDDLPCESGSNIEQQS